MKLFKTVVVVLIFLVNLLVAQPSWAETKFTENPDYIAVTQTIDSLLQQQQTEGVTPENVQKIADLRFQKYLLERGKDWGQCRNETGKTLVVYGRKRKQSNSTYDNALYFLPSGQKTDDGWDCDGVYLSSDEKVAGLESVNGQEPRGAVVYKIVDGTQLLAKTNPVTSEIEFNISPAQVFHAGDQINWFIPDTLQAALNAGIANAPLDD